MDNLDFGMLAATQNFSKKSHDIDDFKLNPELRNIISKMMLSKSRDNIYELNDYMLRERFKMPGYQMTHEEAMELESFIAKFTILKQNQESNTIDLALVVKGFPKIINRHSIKKVELLNFQRMQRVLISFFNDDQDEMFAYFDTRMTSRLDQLKNNTAGNSQKLETIVDSTKKLYDYISLQQVINRLYQTMGMQNIGQTSP